MCGIAGLVLRHTCGEAHLPEEAAAHVRAMLDSMAWRGPDGQGVSLDGPVCLGHRRLSIIDLSGGAQPMSNGRHTLTFNGEIYNYRELRAIMEQEGFRFRTSSDTEVLLAAYERWDTDCLSRLDGMFAFALWDARRRRLFCARDRFDKKPFFYAQTRHFFIFASELHALARVPSLKLTLSPEALPRFMPYDYVPTPDTPYVEARSLPPAHWLLLQEGMPHIERYWDLPMPDETDERSEEDLCEELRALMFNAVRRRMISDVPLGVFLSGGIDSSIVAGCMALHANQPVKTFSIGFREASYDESRFARIVATSFATAHHEEILSAGDCADILPDIISHMDVPLADPSVAPTWLLARLARRHVTVALGGDGADELWAGYEHYIGFDLAERYNRLPFWLRRGLIEPLCRRLPASAGYINPRLAVQTFLHGAHSPAWRRVQVMLASLMPSLQGHILAHPDQALLRPENLFAPTRRAYLHWPDAASPLARAFYVYVHGFMLDDILVKVDRCSMLHSLEVRAPFLDTALAEFTARLPVRHRLHGFQRKYLLKKAFADLLPQEILRRGKRGFQIPVAAWLRGRLRPLMEDMLSADRLQRQGIFNPRAVQTLMRRHISGAADHRRALWNLLVWQLWLQGRGL